MERPRYIAGLDGLRFLSITFVVLHHLFTFMTAFGFTAFHEQVLGLIGYYGIQFFFMGSGFLITYLLLTESERRHRVDLKKFYSRRVLRIWPAYYLLISIVVLLLLHSEWWRIPGYTERYAPVAEDANKFYFFFVPHLEPFFHPTAPYVHHTYTIGIEEQFYLVWGLLFLWARKYILHVFLFLVLTIPVLNAVHAWSHGHEGGSRVLGLFNNAVTYLQYSRFSTFAIGSLFGYAYFYQKPWINVFRRPTVQLLVYAVLVASIALRVELPFVQNEYISGLMACFMLMASFRENSLVNYEAPWLGALGRISYGIYLFHIIAIVLVCRLVAAIPQLDKNSYGTLALLCVLTLGLSTAFGWLSYHFFERFFLRLKRRLRTV
ncbi:acyltransferase [Flaviaesturariibacter amylovorans]|uniref:Acyltransferase 3 domain-containing protein n=1 Tax=Flaviaesturariibacter amylovorans TaxID=1084520 RepID=A0ABP8GL68_9BACT